VITTIIIGIVLSIKVIRLGGNYTSQPIMLLKPKYNNNSQTKSLTPLSNLITSVSNYVFIKGLSSWY